MFVETSAIVEVLTAGPQADRVLARIEAANTPFRTSPTVEFEATVVLASKLRIRVDQANARVRTFLDELGAETLAITADVGALAVEAFARYGKGQGHKAKLNFGDCFAYASARAARLPLLFVGNDFAQTDLA